MLVHRIATGLSIALLALPATATAETLAADAAATPYPYYRSSAGDMFHEEGRTPRPAATKLASLPENDPAWPEIAFAGFVVLAAAGGIVRLRLRREHRVAA
jgi:hypothetical protein